MADKYTAEQIKALGEKGQAFKKADGTYSYPIADADDLASAIHAVGRGSASHEDIRVYIMAQAKALDLSDKIPDTWNADGSMKDDTPRAEVIQGDTNRVATRAFVLDDISIRSGGDGRTVVAYAAVFENPYEVHDQDAAYFEVLDRATFSKTVAERFNQIQCIYNHGKTLYGTPSERFSMPLGMPLEIKGDQKGLLTVTRYNRTPLADDVLETIRSGEMRSQSFRGQFMPGRSQRTRGTNGELDTIRRSEARLMDYGPTPIPVASAADIVGIRSGAEVVAEVADTIAGLPEADRRELVRIFDSHRYESGISDARTAPPTINVTVNNGPAPVTEPAAADIAATTTDSAISAPTGDTVGADTVSTTPAAADTTTATTGTQAPSDSTTTDTGNTSTATTAVADAAQAPADTPANGDAATATGTSTTDDTPPSGAPVGPSRDQRQRRARILALATPERPTP